MVKIDKDTKFSERITWRANTWRENDLLCMRLQMLDMQAARSGPFLHGDEELLQASENADVYITEYFRKQLQKTLRNRAFGGREKFVV